ncbi:flagellar biosynthesis repressor FlbT [Paracoccus aminophilus]|uniref:Flagellar biosynthesis repressor FlbT n=1 Tax=Paracoccus aminophilus JCM 7686 TaxID=1367847 RepID=S5XVG5_PARAH|nr:flagellar biosynthesis repressor FlbT [Paracoccus aminophilus]AGT09247.1 flagellar biosynthesis repressor FlbT [Paracoccus aminophilus JCM 7686]
MGGLILRLAPMERFLINGAVIENGAKRTQISIRSPDARILRLRDAIHPRDVRGVLSEACYTVQLVLTGDYEYLAAFEKIMNAIIYAQTLVKDQNSDMKLQKMQLAWVTKDVYPVLKGLKYFLELEKTIN